MDNRDYRGIRTRTLREQLGLSRQSFEEKTTIPYTSLRKWEAYPDNKLTEKGARRLVNGYAKLGVYITIEWLMHGVGKGPIMSDELINSQQQKNLEQHNIELSNIQAELELFKEHYPDAIDFFMQDDSMAPQILAGDFVAGINYYKNDILQALDKICLITLTDGAYLLRKLQKGMTKNHYNLIALNLETKAPHPFINDVEVIAAAPVIWIRRKIL